MRDVDGVAGDIGEALLALGSLEHESSIARDSNRGERAMRGEKPNHAGMTTNERLFAAGLLDQFDQAARKRDRTKMIELLGRVELADDAAAIADTILANPICYGFRNSN